MLNQKIIKQDFPIFKHQPNLTYLDSAATSLKPSVVIDAEKEYLEQYSANVGRGLYPIAEKATEKFEAVRENIARFIGATSSREIIFTSGTTHSINLAAQLLESFIRPGDNIVVTELEHHSNFLPWKELARRKNIGFRVAPIDTEGLIDAEALAKLVDERTAIIAFSAVSNVTGGINPVADIVKRVKANSSEAMTVIDAAQAIGHSAIDVSGWNADFVAFSAHKCFGSTGVGVLYGKEALLEKLPPVSFGGGMVLDACADETEYKNIPFRFEAGTPNIGGVIAFGAALDYIGTVGIENIRAHEISLAEYALAKLNEAFESAIRIIGPKDPEKRGGIVAFALDGMHPHDIAHLLGESGISVRAGEHCAAPLHRALELNATTRISFSIYNDKQDIDKLISTMKAAHKILNFSF